MLIDEELHQYSHHAEFAAHLGLRSAGAFWAYRFGATLDDSTLETMRRNFLEGAITRDAVRETVTSYFGDAGLAWLDNDFLSTTTHRAERQQGVLETFVRPMLDPKLDGAKAFERTFDAHVTEGFRKLEQFMIKHMQDIDGIESDYEFIKTCDGYLYRLFPAKRLVESEYAALLWKK